MAVADSLTLVVILFGLAMLGWLAEFYLHISSEIADGLTTNKGILSIKDTLTFFVSFIHSNFFALVVALALTNFVVASRTTLNPVWAGLFAVASLFLFWLLDAYIVSVMYETLGDLQTSVNQSNMHWAELFLSNWYFIAISGVLGSLIAYVRGVRNEKDLLFGGGSWRRRRFRY